MAWSAGGQPSGRRTIDAPLRSLASLGTETERKWEAGHRVNGKRLYLGCYATEKSAALAIDKYVNDGVNPLERRDGTSQCKGFSWDKRRGKWKAACKRTWLGYHATEEAAAQAYNNYVKDGIAPVKHRSSSGFKGVGWDKHYGKWRAQCKDTFLRNYATEEAAAQAYNKEAERIGRVDLNVIPPVADDADNSSNTTAAAATVILALPGPAALAHAHAGTGSKRAAPTTPAPPHANMTRLGTSAAAANVRAATAADVHSAALEARVNEEVQVEDSYEEAEEAEAGGGDEEEEGRREQHAHATGANLSRRPEAGSGAAGGSKRAAYHHRHPIRRRRCGGIPRRRRRG